jgi:hypothetical protein
MFDERWDIFGFKATAMSSNLRRSESADAQSRTATQRS